MITALKNSDIHRITSAQVITDLTSAIKELVENSIDANSSRIEIVVKNYGIDQIDVIDNGDGINTRDHETICLKHYTSKLRSFEDLLGVSTLGFRGEAMSSLCSISKVKITTATKDEYPKATVIEFNKTGQITSKSVISGSIGTSIQVSDLFEGLPVRRKEFIKNSKREFQKALNLIQYYALIAVNVRFTVYSVSPKGKKSLVLGTQGANSLKGNLLSVYGSNGMHGLIPVDISLELPINRSQNSAPVTIAVSGYVSSCSFGQGRSSADRQVFFINNRPVNMRNFGKMINEVYKTFNHVQYPSIILNFLIDPSVIDVNVTPDKRTVMIQNETVILDLLRERLIGFYDDQKNLVPKSRQPVRKDETRLSHTSVVNQKLISRSHSENGYNSITSKSEKQRSDGYDEREESDQHESVSLESGSVENLQEQESSSGEESDTSISDSQKHEIRTKVNSEEIRTQRFQSSHKNKKRLSSQRDDICDDLSELSDDLPITSDALPKKKIKPSFSEVSTTESMDGSCKPLVISVGDLIQKELPSRIHKNRVVFEDTDGCCNIQNDKPSLKSQIVPPKNKEKSGIAAQKKGFLEQLFVDPVSSTEHKVVDIESVGHELSNIPCVKNRRYDSGLHHLEGILKIDLEDIAIDIPTVLAKRSVTGESENTLSKTRIEDIKQAEKAEEKLTLSISKKDFLHMKVVGQFNLGFIIVTKPKKNGDLDLLIIDQHASDEKYNYENLQKHTVFESQQLVALQAVGLNSIDELLVLDNIKVFEKNGFKLSVDEEGYPGERVKLKSLPVSKSTLFDESDFNELVHLIKENDGYKGDIKCSKIRAMFASRACRMSIMIGKPLSTKTMTRVVRNLSGLDKPWNCPHGRPTMRHLMELNDWNSFDKDYIL